MEKSFTPEGSIRLEGERLRRAEKGVGMAHDTQSFGKGLLGEEDFKASVLKEVRNLLGRGEQVKVDFKSRPPAIADLAKHIAAIANTDDPDGAYYENENFKDHGFIIIGAEPGRITGYDTWEYFNNESDEARVKDLLEDQLRNLIDPLPAMSVMRFVDQNTELPFWVLLIYPSNEQPHLLVRNGHLAFYTRQGASSRPANARDYGRLLAKAVSKAMAPLESHMRDIQRRLDEEERRLTAVEKSIKNLTDKLIERGLDALTSSKKGKAASPSPLEEAMELMNTQRSLEEVARYLRISREDPVESALNREVDGLRGYLDSLPWSLRGDLAEWKRILEEIQEKTEPLLRGLGELVWADPEGRYAPKVREALERLGLAPVPPPYVTSWTLNAESFRLYPLLLAVYHLGMLAHFHKQPDYLRTLLAAKLPPQRDGSSAVPLLPWLRDRFYSNTDALFKRLHPQRCEPLGWHLYNLLFITPGLTWLQLPPRVKEESALYRSPSGLGGGLAAYLEGEFVLGLLALKPQLSVSTPRPLVGLYTFEHTSLSRIEALVANPPEHLCQVLELSRKTLKEYLEVLARTTPSSGLCMGASAIFRRLSQGQLGSCP